VPRLRLKSGRTLTASVPWAAPRGRFTLSFEAYVIALLQQCRTVRGAHSITNAAAEGINSVIQSLKHAARGLPSFDVFRIRVLFFLGKLDLTPA